MSIPQVLKQVWMMDSSDINVVGQHLGYDWNKICDEIRDQEFYAQDGAGTFTVDRDTENGSKILNCIMKAIFDANPGVDTITINNDF